MAQQERTPHPAPRLHRIGDRTLEVAESVVYIGIAAVLVVTALALLALSAGNLAALVRDLDQSRAIDVLDDLLLIFIVVELLYAVRATIARRELVAEPFLLVGIIASIKEIVVLSVKAADDAGTSQVFRNELSEIAVLGVLVLLLGVTILLLRAKERQPQEGSSTPEQPAHEPPAPEPHVPGSP
jgi:uncharacterized membrane protein (DUF373 family)